MAELNDTQKSALYDAGTTLYSTLEVDEVLKRAAAMGAAILQARQCLCCLFENERVERSSSDAHPPDGLISALRPLLETTRGSAQTTHLTGLAANSAWRSFDVGELILAPMKAGDSLLGALYIDRAVGSQPFTDGDVVLCEAFAGQAGVAAGNALNVMGIRKAHGAYLSGVTFHMRTPIHGIKGFAELLLKEYDGPINDLQKQSLERIRDSANYIIKTVGEMLEVAIAANPDA